jgi:hypothetical protein
MEISKITDYLYIAPRKAITEQDGLEDLNPGLLIDMIAYRRPPRLSEDLQIRILWLRTFDFPLLPIPVRTLFRGVEAALPVIENGHSVLVYCEAGRHRSAAMASAILIAKGYTAQDAMQLISEQREVADPWAYHIQRQIRKFEARWYEHQNP